MATPKDPADDALPVRRTRAQVPGLEHVAAPVPVQAQQVRSPRRWRTPVALALCALIVSVALLLLGRELSVDMASATRSDKPPVSFAASNAGFIVNVTLPVGATALRYRLGDLGAWTDTGASQQPGQRGPQTWFMLPPGQGATSLQLSFTDEDGQASPVHAYPFEPERELAQSMRRNLEQFPSGWVAFRAWGDKTLIYFTMLVTNRCALREIRYGLDGAPPTTPFEIERCVPGAAMPGAIGTHTRVHIEVPRSTRTVRVELTYFDGARSEARTFQAPPEGQY